MFRSLAATHLAPGRDIGVMAFGRVWKTLIGYEAGVFEHDGKNARTNNPNKVFGGQTKAGRVTIEPLRNVKNAVGDLSLGVAFTQSDVPEGISGLRGQTVLEQNFFSSADYLVGGPRRRTGIEMEFLPGPASIKAEWMKVETQRRGQSVEDTDLSPLVGEGLVRQRDLRDHRREEIATSAGRRSRCCRAASAPSKSARASKACASAAAASGEQGSREPARGHHPRQPRPGHDVRRELVHQPVLQECRRTSSAKSWTIRRRARCRRQASFATKAIRFQFSL